MTDIRILSADELRRRLEQPRDQLQF